MAVVPPRQSKPAAQQGDVLDRIDRAIARIEAAATSRTTGNAALMQRHETLRARMGEAIAALDGIIARPATPGRDD